MRDSATLLIHCPDRKGLVAAISNFLFAHGANILHADQHQDNELGLFFMRVEWSLADFDLGDKDFRSEFSPIAARFEMRWRLEHTSGPQSVAIFVSRYQHCLADLLQRHQGRESPCRIPLILSNHPDARPLAEFYGIRFHHVPVEPGRKDEAERRQIELLDAAGVELIVLARYMQALSPFFVARYPERIINVHHSFLPAFSGAKPHHAAFRRGVKLIGATAHYVTEALDDGPIIEQDVARVSHRHGLEDFIRAGRDLEKVVLSRAVRWNLEHRILCYSNKTVVFE
ncbi:MAG: formyltetrahydrofolate deformylase [Acidobacteria bacterium]|nr:formyltetrahydrofolate deformylase [Acidobacteriota bacterium]